MGRVSDILQGLSFESEFIDLSNSDLNDKDLEELAQSIGLYSKLTTIDISENGFTYDGLSLLLAELRKIKSLREINISNIWLLENSLTCIQDVMIELEITTLKMCNIQLNENSIIRLCGLKISRIQNLYLDNNSISDNGLQFLLTTLLLNSTIRYIYLRNNSICDSGVCCLCDFLEQNKSVVSVDICKNTLYKHSSLKRIEMINSVEKDRILYTYPELSPIRKGITSEEIIKNKLYKDGCVVFQLLRIILQIQNVDASITIPRELLFNQELASHQKIIKKLIEQPSVLCERIDYLYYYISGLDEDIDNNFVVQLVLDNLPLLIQYFVNYPILRVKIEGATPDSSFTTVEVDSTLLLPVGRINRAGMVKIHLLSLLQCIISKDSLLITRSIIISGIHGIIIKLYDLHPWNSAIHQAVTSYFLTALEHYSSSLCFDVIANYGLVHFIMKTVLCPSRNGYKGFIILLSQAVERVYEENKTLFIKLYTCTEEDCLHSVLDHPITRERWHDFFSRIILPNLHDYL